MISKIVEIISTTNKQGYFDFNRLLNELRLDPKFGRAERSAIERVASQKRRGEMEPLKSEY